MKIIKGEIRIPTETYAYINIEVEGTAEEIIEEHNRLQALYKGGEGLPQKDFDAWLDRYLTDKTGDADQYYHMNKAQQNIIQIIKRSIARLNRRNGVDEVEVN